MIRLIFESDIYQKARMSKKQDKWAVVSARLEPEEKELLQEAAREKRQALGSFLVESGLTAAAAVLGRTTATGGVKRREREQLGSGPPGWEGQGRNFALSIQERLASRFDESQAKERMGWLQEELDSGDRFTVWRWLELWFPAEAKRIPAKKQNLYLKGFMEALKQA